MPIRIDLPDGTIGEFPDGMSDREIERVLQRQFGYTGPEKSDVGQQIIGNLGAILGDPKPSPYRAPLVEKPVVPLSTPYNTAKNKPGRGLLLAGDVPRAQAMIESEARKTRAAQEQQANADIERAFGTRSILGDTGESIGAAALRAPAIVGNLIKLPSTIYNAAGLPSDPRIGPDPLAVLGDALIAPADRANAARLPDLGIEDVGDALRPSVPMTLGERAATIGSAFQQGFTSSAADMAGAVIAPVPYAAGYTNQAATERAKNDGRDSANLGDLGVGAADAAVQTFFERWATKRLFTGAPGIAPSGITNTFKRIAKESGIQAATEFLEESFDYASTHYGTQKGGNFWDMVKQGLNGAFIGGPLGTAAQGTQEVFRGDPYESADRASLRNHIADRRTPQDQRLAAALELAQRGEWSNKALAQLGEVQTPMHTNIRANSEPEDRKRSNAIAPETLAAGNAVLVTPQAPNAAPRQEAQPAPVVPPIMPTLGDAAVAPEPTADLDALIAANLPPAAPVPANPSIEGAGVAATPDIDWSAAAAALGIDPGDLGAAASSLFGDGTTPAPVLDVPRMDAELGAPAPVLDAERIASLLGLPSEQAAVAQPAKPQAPEVQSEPGLPEPSRFGPLDLRQEIGWSQRGGELVRAMPENQNQFQQDNPFMQDKGEVIGRTRWTGWPAPDGTESTFWRTRPDRSLTEKQANEALDKFERGEKLRPIEQRFIDHAKATAADYDRAMQLQEDAERGYSEVERQAALDDMRAQHDIDVLGADSSEALSLYEIARRAAERGVDDFDIAQAANESNQAYAARLWKLIEEADRGTDTGAAAEDRAGGDQGREGGAQRIQERGFQLAQQPAQEAGQTDQVAPSAGLFGAPTTRDFIDAAKRSRDDARNGKTGTGRTDMLAGDGELFAGPRPEQARVDALAPSVKGEEKAKIRNFGWDAVKLADLSQDDLNALREQVYARHANPKNARGAHVENGQETIYLYDREGRRKLDALAWASTYRAQESHAERERIAAQIAANQPPPNPPAVTRPPTQEAKQIPQQAQEPAKPVQMTMAEWKATHKDFKGRTDGQRTVLRGGRLVPVEIIKETKPAPTAGDGGLESVESVEDAPKRRRGGFTDAERAANFRRWSGGAPLVTAAAAESYAFKSGEAVVVEGFHGAKRPDRIGKGFNAKRATSGPMAYFTSGSDVASNYATGKDDTSLAYEDTDFANWFKVKVKGYRSPIAIDRAWWSFSREDQQRIAALAPRVQMDDDAENIILGDESNTNGLGNFAWELKQARGNPLKALVESWLSSGTIYGEEQRFMDVLALAGVPMDAITYDSPNAEFPSVFPVHIRMGKPLVTTDIPQRVMDRLGEAAKRDRARATLGADSWDKRTTTLREWVSDLRGPNADMVWTRIPDKVTDVLRDLGYDGIVDMGGKGGGPKHRVYIPFSEGQVKGKFNKGGYDESKRDLLESAEESRRRGEEAADLLEIRDAVDAAVGPGRVIYLTDHTGLPDRLRAGVESRMAERGGKGRTAALYDPQTKQVYLFTDVVTDPKRAVWHVMHEIAGHHGLREFLGDRLDRALDMALQNPTVRAVADAIARERGIDMGRQSGRLLAAEEALAELAAAVRTGNYDAIQSRYGVEVGEGIRARVAAAIENFIRRLKAALDDLFGNNGFTDEDVRGLLEAAWQAARNGGEATGQRDALESVEPFNESAYRPQVVAWAKTKFGDRIAPNDDGAIGSVNNDDMDDADNELIRLYHGGNAGLSEISGGIGPGNIFGGIFASSNRDSATSHGDGSIYVMDVRKEDVLTQRDLDYEVDPAKVESALRIAMPWLDESDYEAAYRAVIDDRADDIDGDELSRVFREDGAGEASWEAQRIRGVVAKALGYKAVEMNDEHGTSYLVLPGVAIKGEAETSNAGNFSPNEGSILESVEATPAFDAATATGAAVLRNGHLLSAIDAIKAAGGDLKAITDAVKARDGAALVRALDEALNAARPAPRVTGLKNAVTDAEREAAGRDPILKEAVKSNEATVYQAMRAVKNDPLAGPEAVARLESASTEGISVSDAGVMLVYKVELMNARNAAEKVLTDAGASETAKQAARQAWEEAEAKIAAVDMAAKRGGSEWGRFGQFWQRMMREDFTLAALERKERARLERPLTAEESATVKAMADKIADLQAKYDALQARVANAESESAYEGLTREMRRPPRHRASPDSLRHAAEAARRRIREAQGVPSRRGQSGAIISPAVFYDYAVIGAYHIANGAARFSDWVAAMRADIGDAFDRIKAEHPNIFKAAQKELEKPIRSDATVAEVLEKIDPANLKPSDVRNLAKAHIGEGLRGEPALIEAMASDLGIAPDEVRSLFVQSDTQREPTMSEAKQELQNLRKYIALQNEIDRLEAGIPKPPRAAPRPDSPAVAAKKAELAELRKKLRPVRDPEGRYQEMRGKQLQKRIDELRDRIARGDFATKPRVPRALSEANERLAFELDKAKEEFHRHQYLEMLKARSKWGKALGFVGDTFNLSRAVMTSVDLSGLLRQGGFVTFGRPVLGARAFFKTLPALLTEEAQHRIMGEIEARPNARLYRKYKLALTGSGGGPLAKVEEAYASRWLDRVALQADQPVRNAIRRARNLALAPTRGSGRVYAAFLSQLRADAFDAMAATMTRTGVPTEAEAQWIADFVNTATGRGKIWGRTDNPGEIVNTLAFAPRLVASRFSLATGIPVWTAPSGRAKKLAAMEYARFLTGIAVTMSLLAYGLGDDDEAFADHFTFDPRSSDFMKLKFGDTRLDPFTGLSQVMTFTSRLFTGETVSGKGVLKPLRAKWTLTGLRRALGEDIPAHEGITEEGKLGFGMRASDGVIGSFLRSKMAPIPGAVVNLLNGADFKGDPITLAQQARELMLPMSFGDIYDVMQDQGIPRGTAMSVLGLLGMSMMVQKQSDKQAFAEFSDRLQAVRTDVKDRLAKVPLDEWQSEFDSMKEEYGPVMDGIELQYYKKDGKYGKAGEPKRDENGKAVIDMRISEPKKYGDDDKTTQVHHIIPDNLARHHPLMAAARKAGYDLDNPDNLIPLKDSPQEGEIAHDGSHPKYDAIVFGALNAEQKRLKREYGGMDKVPEGELLEAVRRVEKKARERLESKDVPVKDGRLAGVPMRAAAAA